MKRFWISKNFFRFPLEKKNNKLTQATPNRLYAIQFTQMYRKCQSFQFCGNFALDFISPIWEKKTICKLLISAVELNWKSNPLTGRKTKKILRDQTNWLNRKYFSWSVQGLDYRCLLKFVILKILTFATDFFIRVYLTFGSFATWV